MTDWAAELRNLHARMEQSLGREGAKAVVDRESKIFCHKEATLHYVAMSIPRPLPPFHCLRRECETLGAMEIQQVEYLVGDLPLRYMMVEDNEMGEFKLEVWVDHLPLPNDFSAEQLLAWMSKAHVPDWTPAQFLDWLETLGFSDIWNNASTRINKSFFDEVPQRTPTGAHSSRCP